MNTTAKVTAKATKTCSFEFIVKVDGKVAGRVFKANNGWTATGRFQGFASQLSFEAAVAAVAAF